MPGNETVYKAVDMIMSEDPQDQLTFPEEFLNSLTPTGLPPYELKLKIGCIVMLLRNLAPSKGLCNVLFLHCWDNCNNRKIQVINSDDDDDDPILPGHLIEESLSLHVEEGADDLPKDIGP
ncbi:hypothetical protein AVEN_18263-1 [Araneus ventricosus]|uniref:DNA helicase Pif1-like 2B domain-containing protein n=1 Tax=Araneus ventricosus TaxID=182803 RepID=A0A4Y2AIQ9_ARAVE|nr:hypothetical protein AVEN_18263-1 [Araneus ventricosus]